MPYLTVQEIETIAERIRDNMHELSKTGRWLGGTTLGNLLTDDWSAIWDGETCRAIRAKSAKLEHICQLGEGNREGC